MSDNSSISQRDEDLDRIKARALKCLDSGESPVEVVTALCSDLSKTPSLSRHKGIDIGMMLLLGGHFRYVQEARRFIEGFR